MMEANYDPETMEQNVKEGRIHAARAKRTIGSHMSIETVIKTLESFDLSRLQQVYLLHLSNDNSQAADFKAMSYGKITSADEAVSFGICDKIIERI